MSLEVYNQVCYHGTTIPCVDEILATKHWKNSDKDIEWLGTGVYFFEKDIEQAINFIKKARCIHQDLIGIVKADIVTDSMIDLDMLGNIRLFMEFKKEFIGYLHSCDPLYDINKIKIGSLMDFMHSVVSFDAIRKTYVVQKSNPLVAGTTLIMTQIQVCVKNHSCINNIERMDYYEC